MAGREDLRKLRQLSTSFYQKFNESYFDQTEIKLKISEFSHRGHYFFVGNAEWNAYLKSEDLGKLQTMPHVIREIEFNNRTPRNIIQEFRKLMQISKVGLDLVGATLRNFFFGLRVYPMTHSFDNSFR